MATRATLTTRGMAAIAGAVVAVAVLAGCASPTTADPPSGWHAYPRAFAVTDANRSGPLALAALHEGCFLAVGMDNTGFGGNAATWTASGDCTHPSRSDDAPSGPGDDSAPSYDEDQFVDAVQGGDGDIVAVDRHAYHNDSFGYDSALARRVDGVWQATARLTEPRPTTPGPTVHGSARHVGPAAVTALPGSGYVAVGRRDDTTYPWYALPTVWTSATGSAWTEAKLPLPAGQQTATPTDVVAAPDGTLVAIGQAGGPETTAQLPVAWRSTDRGGHWTLVVIPATAGTWLGTVVATGSGFTAVGGTPGHSERTAVWTSPTGTRWSADRSAAQAGARPFAAAVALPDGGLLAAAATGNSTGPDRNQECAATWHRDVTGHWTQESLGCHGVPGTMTVLPDGRIAAAFWSTLWLHPPYYSGQ